MSEEYIKGLKCPLCEEETMYFIEHLYANLSFGLKWFHCDSCDKDICKDRLSSVWKVAAYDVDIPEEEGE